MNKLEKDGKVAVIVSPGFGAGWSTWAQGYAEGMCMDADIAEAVLAEDYQRAYEIAESKYPGAYTNQQDLEIHWVTKGEAFEITEYDGFESLQVISERRYMVA